MNKIVRLATTLLSLLLLAQPAAAQLGDTTNTQVAAGPLAVVGVVPVSAAAVAKYSKFEVAAQLTSNKAFTNPNDPAIVDINVTFISPSKKTYKGYAFYMIPYTRTTDSWQMGATDTPWHVRFSPNEVGEWSYSFTVTDKSGPGRATTTTSANYQFSCLPSAAPGFLRVAKNKRYLEFSEGQSFFGVAEDLRSSFNPIDSCHATGPCKNGPCYDFLTQPLQLAWMKSFRQHGGNLVRVWLESYSYEFEWEKLGDYSGRQNRAADLDALVEEANAMQVYIHLVLYDARALGNGPTAEKSDWRFNPYKQAFDLGLMHEFYTDRRAITAYKNRLRYIQSRWGYSPAIASYGLLNEPELPGDSATHDYYNNSGLINLWFENMAHYLKKMAYPAHLNSIDYAYGFSSDANKSGSIDFTNTHYYSWDKNVNYQRAYVTQNHLRKYNKPYVQTEFSPSTYGWIADSRNEDIRQAIWSSALSGSFATAFYFGGESKYHNICWGGDGIRLFRPLSKFLEGEVFNKPKSLYEPIGNAYSAYKSYPAPPLEFSPPPDAPAFDEAGFATKRTFISRDFAPKNLARDVVASNPRIEVFALRSPEKILGWVHDKDYYWYNLPHSSSSDLSDAIDNQKVPSGSLPDVTPLDNQTMTISGLRRDGVYKIQWFSANYDYDSDGVLPGTEDGGLITNKALGGSTTETAKKGVLVVRIPKLQPTELKELPYAPDYGFKIIPQ